jgi:DNA-directed RNA polymerase subunit RPC12/RpoP
MKKLLYRIMAQTDTMTVSADTAVELTLAEAREKTIKSVLNPDGQYNNHILQPIGTLNGWKYGHINFCPRCGKNISEEMGDSRDIVNNYQQCDCPECDAEVMVHIIRTPEEA